MLVARYYLVAFIVELNNHFVLMPDGRTKKNRSRGKGI